MPQEPRNKFFITTAIDYANATPHLGTAYEKIGADVIARYHRLRGEDVFFLMGNDEHSLNVEKKARELGKDPKAYCDEMAGKFTGTWRKLDVSYDRFIRTTEKDHKVAVRKFLQAVYDNGKGDIYKGRYEGWYCVSCEAFYQEKDLVSGNCAVHGRKVERIQEENWFFRLSAYQKQLEDHILEHPEFIEPESRRNEILNVVRGGLQDVSISRAGTKWGIPLSFDEKSVAYVWVDALINYITGAGYGTDEERFGRTWPADVHVIGKDITRFHCIIWPALLLAAGLEPPRKVHAHGFVNLAGAKMSKTLGTVLDPIEVAEKIGVDALRYFLMREIPFDRDGDFTWERVQDVCNADLANGIGNLLARTTAMIERYQGGKVVKREGQVSSSFRDDLHLGGQDGRIALYDYWMNRIQPNGSLMHVWTIVWGLNQFIADKKPFTLAKDPANRDRVEEILFTCWNTLRILAILVQPVIPSAAQRMWEQLGLERSIAEQRVKDQSVDGRLCPPDARAWEFSDFPSALTVKKGPPLFPRLELIRRADAKR
jgi:methionyl-tRNA synthetase